MTRFGTLVVGCQDGAEGGRGFGASLNLLRTYASLVPYPCTPWSQYDNRLNMAGARVACGASSFESSLLSLARVRQGSADRAAADVPHRARRRCGFTASGKQRSAAGVGLSQRWRRERSTLIVSKPRPWRYRRYVYGYALHTMDVQTTVTSNL